MWKCTFAWDKSITTPFTFLLTCMKSFWSDFFVPSLLQILVTEVFFIDWSSSLTMCLLVGHIIIDPLCIRSFFSLTLGSFGCEIFCYSFCRMLFTFQNSKAGTYKTCQKASKLYILQQPIFSMHHDPFFMCFNVDFQFIMQSHGAAASWVVVVPEALHGSNASAALEVL